MDGRVKRAHHLAEKSANTEFLNSPQGIAFKKQLTSVDDEINDVYEKHLNIFHEGPNKENQDPNEWTNLADNVQFAAKKAEIKSLLQKENKDDSNGNTGYAFKGGKKFKGAKAIQKKMNQEAE
jgi:hypothetical protein